MTKYTKEELMAMDKDALVAVVMKMQSEGGASCKGSGSCKGSH
ncbi:MAG: hypothetical protein AAB439_04015 [Patescibacteria group bacterium]